MKTDIVKELSQEETRGLVLLPCPFCGSAGVALSREYTITTRVEDDPRRHNYELVRSYIKTRPNKITRKMQEVTYFEFVHKKYTVCCSNKSCIARKTYTGLNELRTAVARWNRRAK